MTSTQTEPAARLQADGICSFYRARVLILPAGPDNPLGCWGWSGETDRAGYGVVTVWFGTRKRHILAHRLAWAIANDQPIPPHRLIRHRCDNPPCTNFLHLQLGTDASNAEDRRVRGRGTAGETHPQAKLSDDDVEEIRLRYSRGLGPQLCREFGISAGSLSDIVNFKTRVTPTPGKEE